MSFTHNILLVHKSFNSNSCGKPHILWDHSSQANRKEHSDIFSLQITSAKNVTSINLIRHRIFLEKIVLEIMERSADWSFCYMFLY